MQANESPHRRRAGRVPLATHIIMSGVDAEGFNFAEETQTLTVSRQGLAVRTSYDLALGQEISVRTKDKNRVAQFEVAWVGRRGTPGEGRVGLEWVEPERFWGVNFPPGDWEGD